MTSQTRARRPTTAELAWPLEGGIAWAYDSVDHAGVHEAPRLSYTVEGPPVPKARPRFGQGRAYTPARTRAYESAARAAAQLAVARCGWPSGGWSARGVRYLVQIDLWLEADRGDADNYAKSIIDAANKVVFPDDSRVCAKLITRRVAGGDIAPRADVTIAALGTERRA